MKNLPLTIGGDFVHSGSSISYYFGGRLVPLGYQSLNRTFSGASNNASHFHYPPWLAVMPSLSCMFIPSMVHTSQTNVAPRSTQQPSLMSRMSVPIPSSIGPSMSLTISQPSMGLSVPLTISQFSIGVVPTGGQPFVGPSFLVWGKSTLTRINPPFGQPTPIESYHSKIYSPFVQHLPLGQKPPLGKQIPLGQKPLISQKIPLGKQPPIGQQTSTGNPTGTQIFSGASFPKMEGMSHQIYLKLAGLVELKCLLANNSTHIILLLVHKRLWGHPLRFIILVKFRCL
jgi:hypothetical protein